MYLQYINYMYTLDFYFLKQYATNNNLSSNELASGAQVVIANMGVVKEKKNSCARAPYSLAPHFLKCVDAPDIGSVKYSLS